MNYVRCQRWWPSSLIQPYTTRVPRRHGIEIHEQQWFPTALRDDVTIALSQAWSFLGYHTVVLPPIQQLIGDVDSSTKVQPSSLKQRHNHTSALGSTHTHSLSLSDTTNGEQSPTSTKPNPTILDLCSGGGGPWLTLQHALAQRKRPVNVIFSDLFPNIGAYKSAQQQVKEQQSETQPHYKVDYIDKPVDATQCSLPHPRTLFASFHHMTPKLAESILADAYNRHCKILIVEATERRWLTLMQMPVAMLVFGFVSPVLYIFQQRRLPAWHHLVFTYLIPINPIVLSVDAFTSTLRTYDEIDIQQMCQRVTAEKHPDNKLVWKSQIGNDESSITTVDNTHQYSWKYCIRQHTGWKFWMPKLIYILGQPTKSVDK